MLTNILSNGQHVKEVNSFLHTVVSSCEVLGLFLTILGDVKENKNSLSVGPFPVALHVIFTRRFSLIHRSINFVCLLLLKAVFSNWLGTTPPHPRFHFSLKWPSILGVPCITNPIQRNINSGREKNKMIQKLDDQDSPFRE